MDETNEKKLDLILKKVDLETPSDVRWRSKRDKAGRGRVQSINEKHNVSKTSNKNYASSREVFLCCFHICLT
jgi:hypothetical protein